MKTAKTIVVLTVACLLNACAGNDIAGDRYYSLLPLPAQEQPQTQPDDVHGQLLLADIQLARPLQGQPMVMRLRGDELHYAHSHFWAEPLKDALAKLVIAELGALNTGYAIARERQAPVVEPNHCLLKLSVDSFYATEQSQAVMDGQFWLVARHSQSGDKLLARQSFAFTRSLTEDGYAHSTALLRLMTADMVALVAMALDNSNQCTFVNQVISQEP